MVVLPAEFETAIYVSDDHAYLLIDQRDEENSRPVFLTPRQVRAIQALMVDFIKSGELHDA